MRFTKTLIAYALLLVCAFARLLLQMAAMPPYAGLDEVYHVARLAFVRAEHRNPTTSEQSMPPYLLRTLDEGSEPPDSPHVVHPSIMPLMGESGDRWPAIVAERGGRVIVDRPLTAGDLKPYVLKNYEA